MTTGTEQRERFPMALEPGYFRPDDLSFEQRVDMMARLAEQLRFIDLDDQEDGDWRGLFATDPTLVMAGIAALDPWPLQQQFGLAQDVLHDRTEGVTGVAGRGRESLSHGPLLSNPHYRRGPAQVPSHHRVDMEGCEREQDERRWGGGRAVTGEATRATTGRRRIRSIISR
ncbi:hypothetical protein FUT87_14620 [Mitsuaria sp. TWR114]|uniref:hypothetical protein n=1 Tax=Mitsuaria sp. TWR114 TaxID=2601731 RepID=UPI0011BEF52D|nr:hypothetical protein [Mitsuaria sp. TWR114]TXD85985.1 hypothetical protein FUT87_14620 [Mitsuaria sp. TWR114]